jgi:hypothetical protein
MELCLSGLFFLVRDAEGNASCTPQGIIMITAMAMTALFHCTVGRSYKLRWRALPESGGQLIPQLVAIYA